MQRIGLLLFLFLQPLADASACFILYLNDGKRVLIGNHEDWPARDAAIRIRGAQPGRFGSVTFTFASEGWPQGGVNEYGLFFDAAQTPAQEVNQHGKESFQGYIWWEVLEKCKSVEEALALLQKYALPELSQAHVVLADATGHAARVGVKNGELAIE